ncbi:MAG: DUF4403 family protein [Gemmatimonadaceae bacterium]
MPHAPHLQPPKGLTTRGAAALRRAGALAAFLVLGCTGAPELEAPPPLVVDDPADSLAPIEPSIIESEVRYDLGPAMASLERAVPRSFGDMEHRMQIPTNQRTWFAFAARRTPFDIRFNGHRASISTVIEYEGRGWYHPPIGPFVSAACATGDVPKPRARVQLVSDLALTRRWELVTRTRIGSIEPMSDSARDRCRVTIFRIDVTDRVMNATRGVLEAQLRQLDSAIANVKTRSRFERWWRDMSRPIRLTDSVWFTINPSDVRLRGVRSDSGELIAGLRLTARPRIETGNRPNDFDLFTPLPPLLRADTGQQGLHVALDGEIDYAVATAMLKRALVAKRIDIGDRHLVIADADLRGIGAGRVALGVRFTGGVSGMMYLTGTPVYDPRADQLLVPDLAYDLHTSNALVLGLAWLNDDAIRDFLRARARFPVNSQIDRLRALAERGMNRDLAQGVRLVATLDRANALAVRAMRSSLRVRAEATGAAHLEIDKPVRIARAVTREAPALADSAGQNPFSLPKRPDGKR